MPQASSDGVTAPTLNKDSLVIEDKGKIILKFIVCKSGGRFPQEVSPPDFLRMDRHQELPPGQLGKQQKLKTTKRLK